MDIIRDLRSKEKYPIDDEYLNGYARLCGIYATCVYNSLSRHANFHTQKCFPAIKKMAEQHNISKPSVIKGIKALEKWGIIKIIKSKDEKGHQSPNEYILLDKIQWKRKLRVNEIDTDNRVNEINEPSQSQNKTRVNEIDHNVININVNKINDNKDNADKSAGAILNDLIENFNFNPSYKHFFKNTTQREALGLLVKERGKEKVAEMIKLAGENNGKEFAPMITSPCQLRDKWINLENYLKRSPRSIKYY